MVRNGVDRFRRIAGGKECALRDCVSYVQWLWSPHPPFPSAVPSPFQLSGRTCPTKSDSRTASLPQAPLQWLSTGLGPLRCPNVSGIMDIWGNPRERAS